MFAALAVRPNLRLADGSGREVLAIVRKGKGCFRGVLASDPPLMTLSSILGE